MSEERNRGRGGKHNEIVAWPPPLYETAELKIGDRVPMPPRKLDIRPAFTGPGAPSFKGARHADRGPGK